jgi:hypothetical protein
LRFGIGGDANLQEMAVNYLEDEDNVLGDFLVIDDTLPFFEWEIEFSEGLEAEIDSNNELSDLEDEVFNIFGTDFTFVDSGITSTGNIPVTLSFMAGDVSDVLREGETKTYTIDGVDYEVTAVFISDPNNANPEAKFAVNGELTDGLQDGDTDTLNNGLQIGVRELLVNSREGVVEFFLGANKVEFTDANTATQSFATGVEIGNENIEDATISVLGSLVSSNTYEITNIKYRLSADASVGSTIYVPPGHGVREYLDEPEGLLSPTFDILYEGLLDVPVSEIDFNARSDHSYDLTVTNLRGKEYEFPFITNKDDVFKFGDDDDDFVFLENNFNTTAMAWRNPANTVWECNVGDDDYFALSEHNISNADYKDDSAVMRYEDIDSSDRLLTFTDQSSGESREVSYQADTTDVELLGTATNFVVEGNTYQVWICNTTGFPLAIDLNGNGNWDVPTNGASRVGFTVNGGGTLDFADSTFSTTADNTAIGSGQALAQTDTVALDLVTPQDVFDGSTGESFGWTIAPASDSGEISLSFNTSSFTGPHGLASGGSEQDTFDVVNDDNADDYDRGISDFGAVIEFYNPSGGNDAEELTIYYPDVQMGAQVFVVAGVTERSAGGAGSVLRDVVNPIAVGLAVLDKDADGLLGSQNLIIVGGPCINTVAAEFLGNPVECTEGFEPGKATISAKEYGSSVATLVAGHGAGDTLGAAYVLADYMTYLADIEGSEVEVVSSDLSDLRVSEAVMMDDMMDDE